jgi:DNA-binding protein HU-beta
MTIAFFADVLKQSAKLTNVAATRASQDMLDAFIEELGSKGKFVWPGIGTFSVRKTKARKALNPRTLEAVEVKAGKTVRFKASPKLKASV